LAPHLLLEEIGAPYRIEQVEVDRSDRADIRVGVDYQKVNPKGRVPALAFADGVLTESPAILIFLAREHPEAKLIPAGSLGEARCLEWMNWLATTVHAGAFAQVVRPELFVADEADYPSVVARGRQNVATAFAFIERQLEGREWPVDGGYSIVDPYLLYFYLAARSAGVPMAERYPTWSAQAERATARPAVQRVLEQEGGWR
jgi:glutathione S-transferase